MYFYFVTDALLPLVHKLWPPFTQRLRDKDLVVVNKVCLKVLIYLIDYKNSCYIICDEYSCLKSICVHGKPKT